MNRCESLIVSEDMLPAYQEYLRDGGRSRATVEKYLRDMKVFLECMGENQVLGKERIREYKEELREQYKVSSASSMLAAVNSFLVFLRREELRVKLLKMQRVLHNRPEREMMEEDYEKLARAVGRCGDLSMSMLLQTIGSTGIRISELRFITVESLEVGRAEIYSKGKSWVVLPPVESSRMLKRYYGEAGILFGSIFVTKYGNPVDRSNVSRRMKQLAREAGVDENRVFPHNFRHLPARIFYSMEKDMVRLVDLLGHASISTIRIYTMTTEDQSRRQMSRMRLVLEQLEIATRRKNKNTPQCVLRGINTKQVRDSSFATQSIIPTFVKTARFEMEAVVRSDERLVELWNAGERKQ